MNTSSNDGSRTSTGSSKSGYTKPEEMSQSSGGHGQSSTGPGSGSDAASTGGTTTNQTNEGVVVTMNNNSSLSSKRNNTSEQTDGNAAATISESSGLTSTWHRMSLWWTARTAKTKIAICLMVALLFMFMIWVIWQASKQKDDDFMSITTDLSSLQSSELPQFGSMPDEPVDNSTTDSLISSESLPSDLSTASETIVAATKAETHPQSSQLVGDKSSATQESSPPNKSPYLAKYENELRKSLNFSADPCDDFYGFVCNLASPLTIYQKATHELYVTLDAAMRQERDQRNHTAKPYPVAVQLIVDIYFDCVDAKKGAQQTNEDEHGFKKLPKVKFECMDIVFTNHSLVCSRLYVDYHSAGANSSTYLSANIEKAHELATLVKASFKSILEGNITWLEEERRKRVLGKLDKLSPKVGFLKAVLDDELLNHLYRTDSNESYFGPEDTWEARNDEFYMAKNVHFGRIFKVISESKKADLRDNKEQVVRWATDLDIWDEGNPSAHYNLGHNSLTIPIHWLKLPMFDSHFPAFYNFAVLGSVLGHEITHGFDRKGSDYDADGRLNPGHMWNKTTRALFEEKAQCFVGQYGKVRVDDRWPTMMNGTSTLNENIADNGAYKIAYYALKSFIKSNGHNDASLSDHQLKAFSTEQLFFIASAQNLCSKRPEKEDLQSYVKNVHSPARHRVNIPLCNFDRFAETFKCNASTRMNCATKCIIW